MDLRYNICAWPPQPHASTQPAAPPGHRAPACREEAYTDCLHGILEAGVEDIDASVVNAQQAGLQVGQQLPRGGERVSLTVRRVLHTYSLGIRR